MGILNGNSIIENARSFANILASSREFQEFYSTQEKLKDDKEASSLLELFQRRQREIQEAWNQTDFSGGLLDEFGELQRKVESNPTIMEWAQAQQDAISLIQEANQVISNAAGFDFGQSSASGGPC